MAVMNGLDRGAFGTWEGGFIGESGGSKSPTGVLGQRHGRRSMGQVPQKLVIFCKWCTLEESKIVFVNVAL